MTIAMLLANTVAAARLQDGASADGRGAAPAGVAAPGEAAAR
jgi:hypothetical protein